MSIKLTGKPSVHIIDRRYEAITTLSRGKNSSIYKARLLVSNAEQEENSIVALKVLNLHNKSVESNINRMRREALAMLSSRHTNVARMYDFVAREDVCYLSMEYADVGDIGYEVSTSTQTLDPLVALEFARQLLSGLSAIHKAGILHRDIKPENLLLNTRGELKITDFGVAWLPTEKEPFEDIERGVGTLDYLAPEYLEAGISDRTTDIYAAGVTIYQLLTNKLPFTGESIAQQLESKVSGNHKCISDRIDDAPSDIDSLIAKALETNPAHRYQTAQEFLIAIEQFLDGKWKPNAAEAKKSSSTASFLVRPKKPTMEEARPLPKLQTVISRSADFKPQSEFRIEGLKKAKVHHVSGEQMVLSSTEGSKSDPIRSIVTPEDLEKLEKQVIKEGASVSIASIDEQAELEKLQELEEQVGTMHNLPVVENIPNPNMPQEEEPEVEIEEDEEPQDHNFREVSREQVQSEADVYFKPGTLSLEGEKLSVNPNIITRASEETSLDEDFDDEKEIKKLVKENSGAAKLAKQRKAPIKTWGLITFSLTLLGAAVFINQSPIVEKIVQEKKKQIQEEIREQQPIILARLGEPSNGIIYGLLENNEKIPFSVFSVKSGREKSTLLALGIDGWTALPIDATNWRLGSPVHVKANGLHFTLHQDNVNSEAQTLSGSFIDHASGRQGQWVIWQ